MNEHWYYWTYSLWNSLLLPVSSAFRVKVFVLLQAHHHNTIAYTMIAEGFLSQVCTLFCICQLSQSLQNCGQSATNCILQHSRAPTAHIQAVSKCEMHSCHTQTLNIWTEGEFIQYSDASVCLLWHRTGIEKMFLLELPCQVSGLGKCFYWLRSGAAAAVLTPWVILF